VSIGKAGVDSRGFMAMGAPENGSAAVEIIVSMTGHPLSVLGAARNRRAPLVPCEQAIGVITWAANELFAISRQLLDTLALGSVGGVEPTA
jgi:hypothetical protein